MASPALVTSLKSMIVPSKEAVISYPGFDGFEVTISYVSRETLQTIRKKATKTTFKNRVPIDEVNDELFLQLYCDAAIKGWKGLKLSFLETLCPVDLGSNSPDAELEFSSENALFLMKNSVDFDSWVSSSVTDLVNFRKSSEK